MSNQGGPADADAGDAGAANASAAADLAEWFMTLQGAMPAAAAALEQLFAQHREDTIAAVAAAVGAPYVPDPDTGGGTLSEHFTAGAGGARPNARGQAVIIDQPWTDPPSPEPDQPFAVCWTEQNTGFAATGAYVARVTVAGEDLDVEMSSLEPDASAQRRVSVEHGLPAGRYRAEIKSPWHGSDDHPALQPQAGYTSYGTLDVLIGQEATDAASASVAASQEAEIEGIANASSYAGYLASNPYDGSYAAWALQTLAAAAPSMADELLGLAANVQGRDPQTISVESQRTIAELAATAYGALAQAQTLIVGDNRDTRLADHPIVLQAGAALRDMATAIINAPQIGAAGESEGAESEGDESQATGGDESETAEAETVEQT